jgi:hypothetical protein
MWLKLSDTVRDDKKIRRLAVALGVSYPEALGHLALLWLWRIEDGDLSDFTADEIAAAAGWRGNARQLLEVLRLGGFIDQVAGRLVLHDHEEHQGSIKEAHRKARQRAKKRVVPARGNSLPSLSRDAVSSRHASPDRSRTVSRDTGRSPATDPFDAEIEQRLESLVAAPAQH